MKRFIKRTTTIILIFAFVLASFTTSIFALDLQLFNGEKLQTLLNNVLQGSITQEELDQLIDPTTVPEIIGLKTAQNRFHVERLYEEEANLNTVLFRNIDGTKTQYTFAMPVKYIDEEGRIKDITTDILVKDNVYQSKDNKIEMTFAKELTNGIYIKNGELQIETIPYGIELQDIQSELQNEKRVIYKIDDYTTYEYELTYTGIKESICVKEKNGITEYRFLMKTHGCGMNVFDDVINITEEETTVAMLEPLIIYAANGSVSAELFYELEEIEHNQEYLVTVHLNEEYINEAKYPIVIDPTINITINDSVGIVDRTIYSDYLSLNDNSGILNIGTGGFGEARILMGFPGLEISRLDESQIISAYVDITNRYDVSRNDPDMLEINCYTYLESWNQSMQWSDLNPDNYDNTVLSTNCISYEDGMDQYPTRHRYSFDITRAVKRWVNGINTKEQGIIFVANIDELENTVRKIFWSHAASSDKPALIFTYDTNSERLLNDGIYYLNNRNTGKYLRKENNLVTSTSGYVEDLGTPIKWSFEYSYGSYRIHPYGNANQYLAATQNGVCFCNNNK